MASPNLYEDNKGKVTKESGGSGGVETYELVTLMRGGGGDVGFNYLIKGATSDIGNLFVLERRVGDDGSEIIRSLYIFDYVGANVSFARITSDDPQFPQYLYVLQEKPMGILVSTAEPDTDYPG